MNDWNIEKDAWDEILDLKVCVSQRIIHLVGPGVIIWNTAYASVGNNICESVGTNSN